MAQIEAFTVPQRALSDLNFMDIYVRLDADTTAHYRSGRGSVIDLPDADVPLEYADAVAFLADHLQEHFQTVEASIEFGGMRMRATRLENARGEIWAALRRLPDFPLPIEKLGFIPQLHPVLHELGRRGGLILVCGASGQGKTSTITSLLTRYLETYGGVGFTIEDPVEYDIEGRHGKNGYCYQTEVKQEGDWGGMLKRALRWHPHYIAVGEIRTPECADQVLRAATSGHTVLATMHAGSIEEALEGLLQLAEHNLGGRAPLLLAAGLTSVIYQAFSQSGLFAQFMITEPNPGAPSRALIRERRIGQVRNIADQQMARLIQNGSVF